MVEREVDCFLRVNYFLRKQKLRDFFHYFLLLLFRSLSLLLSSRNTDMTVQNRRKI